MTIFAEMTEQQAKATHTAIADYIDLLGRMNTNSPSPEDEAALAYLLAVLGKSPEDAEHDHKRVSEVARLRELAGSFDSRKAESYEANKALIELCAEHQELNARMRDEMKAANGWKQDARAKSDHALDAVRKLQAIDLESELSPRG